MISNCYVNRRHLYNRTNHLLGSIVYLTSTSHQSVEAKLFWSGHAFSPIATSSWFRFPADLLPRAVLEGWRSNRHGSRLLLESMRVAQLSPLRLFLSLLFNLQKVNSIDKVSGAAEPGIKQKTLDYRRCVLLAIVGATPTESPSLDRILSDGYLLTVKTWLEEALSSSEGMFCIASVGRLDLLAAVKLIRIVFYNRTIGGVDMLLHLLSNIASLPVTKSVVKDSGMGKAIGSIEKHSKCKDTPNESAIKERVQRVKDEWQASVKARKAKTKPKEETVASPKRPLELSISVSSPAAKRTRTGSSTSAFSSLLKKVSKPTATKTDAAKSDAVEKKPLPKVETQSISAATSNGTATEQSNGQPDNNGMLCSTDILCGLRIFNADTSFSFA